MHSKCTSTTRAETSARALFIHKASAPISASAISASLASANASASALPSRND